jgi:hypothetical protein
VLEGPRVPSRPTGGRLCAPLVRELLERSLLYLGFPPDRPLTEEQLLAYQQRWLQGGGSERE